LGGLSVLEAPIEFGLTGRRVADGKATSQAESPKALELSAQPELAVRLVSRFFCVYMRVFTEWARVVDRSTRRTAVNGPVLTVV
jgi:hypothetical protein